MPKQLSELNAYLWERVPEVRAPFERLLEWWADIEPGAHITYGDILAPRIVELLDNPEAHLDEIERIFQLLEELSADGRQGLRDVVGASVCEYLEGQKALDRARKFMGPTTRELCSEF